ncbi:MAG: DNA damage-inducible protein D [Proteobacteria bacterium]|nr:DNA damage-inducible protein D [Pseudomonadota bacterium]MBU4036399.1 DNA damage-inducible protein D [Pseudomonadota bacterium]
MAKVAKTAGSHKSPFERIKRKNDAGMEFWSSRDFSEILGYGDYRNFEGVIEKAKMACFNSGHRIEDHFVDVTELIEIGKGGQRPVKTVLLSRYACYLVIQNADPKKEIVAHGQTYFAIQTRRQELADERIEEERRILLRKEIRHHNVQLADAAKNAGVTEPIDYAIFQNHGYMGLYGGLKQEDIHRRKGLKKSQKILDHMGSTELAANLFRATQAEEKLRRDKVKGKEAANITHRKVGAKVRQTIRELGGTMPEELPVAESIKKIETKQRKQLGKAKASARKKGE